MASQQSFEAFLKLVKLGLDPRMVDDLSSLAATAAVKGVGSFGLIVPVVVGVLADNASATINIKLRSRLNVIQRVYFFEEADFGTRLGKMTYNWLVNGRLLQPYGAVIESGGTLDDEIPAGIFQVGEDSAEDWLVVPRTQDLGTLGLQITNHTGGATTALWAVVVGHRLPGEWLPIN